MGLNSSARSGADRYRDVSAPTLLLWGSETEHHPSFATRDLERTLPNVRSVRLEGQGHLANLAAPNLVAVPAIVAESVPCLATGCSTRMRLTTSHPVRTRRPSTDLTRSPGDPGHVDPPPA